MIDGVELAPVLEHEHLVLQILVFGWTVILCDRYLGPLGSRFSWCMKHLASGLQIWAAEAVVQEAILIKAQVRKIRGQTDREPLIPGP